MSAILDEFGSHRLLTFDRDPATGDAIVEVAHEAPLTEWARLAGWIDRYRADLRRHAALSAAVEEWESSGRDYLLAGGRLAEHEAWSRDSVLQLTEQEREFVDAGTARQRAEQSEDAARRGERLRLQPRARTRLVVLFVAVVLLTGAVTFGTLACCVTVPRGGRRLHLRCG